MDGNHQMLEPEKQERAREFARIRRRLWALSTLCSGIYISLWFVSGAASRVAEASRSSLNLGDANWWIPLLFVAAALAIPWRILTLPLSFYSGFILPHRYDLSTQTISGWISDLIKGGLVSTVLGLPLLVGLYAFIRAYPTTWWIVAAAGFTLFTVILAILAPILLMPIFYKFKPLGEEFSELSERLLSLANRTGTKVRGVYSFDMSRRTRAANAGLTGLSHTRRIILGDTLLNEFTPDEIETVLAHELAHHVHRDIPIQLIFQTAFNFIAFFIAAEVIGRVTQPFDLSNASDPGGLPLLALVMGVLGLVTMPITNGLSRWREKLADRFALEITSMPGAFKSAMIRVANQNLAEVDPEPWVVFLFYSHPPLRERIRMAETFGSD